MGRLLKRTHVLLSALALAAAGSGCCTSVADSGKVDLAQVEHGMVCFTFDDGVYQTWLPRLELFRKYHAHATFFYSGEITPEAIDSMKQLQAAGHSVGLHGLKHRNAPEAIEEMGAKGYFDAEIAPQLAALENSGVKLEYYAYPNNRYNDASNELLSPHFKRFRAGVRPYLAKGQKIADCPQAFYDLKDVPTMAVLGGVGIGPYYSSTQADLDAALEKAAKENKLIVFFSHKILPAGEHVNMSADMLEKMLQKADALGMKVVGFGELPR